MAKLTQFFTQKTLLTKNLSLPLHAMSTTDNLLFECRYYNGEEENPFLKVLAAHEVDKSHLPPPDCLKLEFTLPAHEAAFLKEAAKAWFCERFWVIETEHFDFKKNVEKHAQILQLTGDDDTPVELKAFLCNHYADWTCGDPDSFLDWYQNFYLALPTNRQRMAEEQK